MALFDNWTDEQFRQAVADAGYNMDGTRGSASYAAGTNPFAPTNVTGHFYNDQGALIGLTEDGGHVELVSPTGATNLDAYGKGIYNDGRYATNDYRSSYLERQENNQYGKARERNEAIGVFDRPDLTGTSMKGAYLPLMPDNAAELELYHNYFTENPELRRGLSLDEQQELLFLDAQTQGWTDKQYKDASYDLRNSYGLDRKVGFKGSDSQWEWKYGVRNKRLEDNPYDSLLANQGRIGGYYDRDKPSETLFQKVMDNPLGQIAINAGVGLATGGLGNLLTAGAQGIGAEALKHGINFAGSQLTQEIGEGSDGGGRKSDNIAAILSRSLVDDAFPEYATQDPEGRTAPYIGNTRVNDREGWDWKWNTTENKWEAVPVDDTGGGGGGTEGTGETGGSGNTGGTPGDDQVAQAEKGGDLEEARENEDVWVFSGGVLVNEATGEQREVPNPGRMVEGGVYNGDGDPFGDGEKDQQTEEDDDDLLAAILGGILTGSVDWGDVYGDIVIDRDTTTGTNETGDGTPGTGGGTGGGTGAGDGPGDGDGEGEGEGDGDLDVPGTTSTWGGAGGGRTPVELFEYFGITPSQAAQLSAVVDMTKGLKR